jgi:hypothetical protein
MFRYGRRRTHVSRVRRTVSGSCAVCRVRRRRRRTAVLAAITRFRVGRRMSWHGRLRSSGRWRSAGTGTLPVGRHGIAVARVGGGGDERRAEISLQRNDASAECAPDGPAAAPRATRAAVCRALIQENGHDSVERVNQMKPSWDSIGVRRRQGLDERSYSGNHDGPARNCCSPRSSPVRPKGVVEQHCRVRPGRLDGGRSGPRGSSRRPCRVRAGRAVRGAGSRRDCGERRWQFPGLRGVLRPFGQPCPDPTVCGAPITFRCGRRRTRVSRVRRTVSDCSCGFLPIM